MKTINLICNVENNFCYAVLNDKSLKNYMDKFSFRIIDIEQAENVLFGDISDLIDNNGDKKSHQVYIKKMQLARY